MEEATGRRADLAWFVLNIGGHCTRVVSLDPLDHGPSPGPDRTVRTDEHQIGKDLYLHDRLPGVRGTVARHQGSPVSLGILRRRDQRVINRGADEPYFRAVTLGRGHLRKRRTERHEHRRLGAQQTGRDGHALRMIARARCDHASRVFVGRESGDAYQRTPHFVGAGTLQVFALQPGRAADLPVQRAARL